MKAVYYVGDCKMEMRDIPVPTPAADEYLIKIDACGVCGSDFEGFLGKTGRRIPPMIMGHEFAGRVAQAPEGGKYAPGTKVAVFPKYYCGECEVCKKGLVNLCPNADFAGVMDVDGAMTEYICVKETYLIPFEGEADVASMAEPAAVAYNGVFKLKDEELAAAEHVLVVGAGPIGLLALAWLKYRGAKHVIVSDATDFRLELAKELGADDTVNPVTCGDFEKAIADLTDGKMCDLSVEAVGITPTAQSSINALKSGGVAVWIGNAAKMVSIDMQKVVTTELQIRGNYIYSKEDFDTCVKLLAEEAINVRPIITHHMDMSQGVEAFELLQNNKEGRAVKIILTNP